MNVYILGSAGWIPGKNETSCILIEYNEELFILDAGTGASNINKYQDIISSYDTINLLLTHYHLDHLIGLIYLDPFVRNKHFRIYGPGKMGYAETTEYYLNQLLRSEFFSRSIYSFSNNVQIFDFLSNSFNIGSVKISVKQQKHSAPSYQIALDDMLIYATDTVFNAKEWDDISAKLLLHECWDIEQSISNRHTSLWQLRNQLPLKQFEKVVLIHQNPAWNLDDYSRIENIVKNTNISLAEDGMKLII